MAATYVFFRLLYLMHVKADIAPRFILGMAASDASQEQGRCILHMSPKDLTHPHTHARTHAHTHARTHARTHTRTFTVSWLQVMSPMRKGPAGVNQLNTSLQALLNPPAPNKPEMSFGPPSMLDDDATVPAVVRVGDRVIQNTNNYQKDVFNGDIGFVAGIKKAEREVLVRFPGKLFVNHLWHGSCIVTLCYESLMPATVYRGHLHLCVLHPVQTHHSGLHMALHLQAFEPGVHQH